MKHAIKLLFITCLLGAQLTAQQSAKAATITNGNFNNCDLNGWQIDTDGFGDIGSPSDFTTEGQIGDCAASINVDYFSPAGDAFGTPVTQAFFANTLFQELDLTGDQNSRLVLDITLQTNSEITDADPAFIADYFIVGLFNTIDNQYYNAQGDLGFLVAPTDINGSLSQMLSFELDSSYLNASGWTLDFQVNIGADDLGFSDAFGSQLLVSNVSLREVLPANAPTHFAFVALGLIALAARARRARTLLAINACSNQRNK